MKRVMAEGLEIHEMGETNLFIPFESFRGYAVLTGIFLQILNQGRKYGFELRSFLVFGLLLHGHCGFLDRSSWVGGAKQRVRVVREVLGDDMRRIG
jgi:hypothetical protein